MLPSLFISHGSPMLALESGPTQAFLQGLGRELERPEAVVVVSAHWDTAEPIVSGSAHPQTIHDFGGFPPALFAIRYPAPGAPNLARHIVSQLATAGFTAEIAPNRGLDHGAWVPLSLIYPHASVPVLQVSIQAERSPSHHAALGAALRPLRQEGVLVLASGSLTHNLSEVRGRAVNDDVEPTAFAFSEWIASAVEQGRAEDLLDYRRRAPHAERHHPTDEHLLPLFVALGAGSGTPGRRLHSATTYGALSMDAYAFD